MTISKSRFQPVLACLVAAAWPAWTTPAGQDQPGQQKEDAPRPDAKAKSNKPEVKNKAEPTATAALDFKVSVEGMDSLPPNTAAELKGLDSCDATDTAHLGTGGEGTFPKVPPCRVQLKIFITGMNTGFVEVDMGKRKAFPVLIQMKSSGEATITNP
jgi:hypothetical protein